MKKIILSLFTLLLFSCMAYCQTDSTPYYIETCQDKMTDKFYAFGSKKIICSEDGKQGLIIGFSWKYKDGEEPEYSGITCKSAKIGTCVENSTLIFLFEDDTKIKLESWNKFNCEGTNYFDFNNKYFKELTSKKVTAVRFDNGRSFESFTYKLKGKEQEFFMEAADAKANKRFVKGKCD